MDGAYHSRSQYEAIWFWGFWWSMEEGVLSSEIERLSGTERKLPVIPLTHFIEIETEQYI
jgi:hypothetical protein